MTDFVLYTLHFKNPKYMQSLISVFQSLTKKSVKIEDINLDINPFYDKNRAQYDAAKILQYGETHLSSDGLIFTSVDLFIPIFTFVFGLARLNSRIAVISDLRLQTNYYGLPANARLLEERIRKEAVHEFGHLKGLRHCVQFNCVMASSTTADDIDIKSSFFCSTCLAHLNTRLL